MIRIEDAVEVDVAAEDAFTFVTRIDGYPAWLPGVLRAEPIGDGAAETGTPAPAAGTPPPPSGTPAPDTGTPAAAVGTPAPDSAALDSGTPAHAVGAPVPGAAFRLVSAGPGGLEIVSVGRVQAVDPPRSITISATSGLFALTASCEITALDVSRSRITVKADVEPRGLATLARGRIERELHAAVPDTLRRLREAVEG